MKKSNDLPWDIVERSAIESGSAIPLLRRVGSRIALVPEQEARKLWDNQINYQWSETDGKLVIKEIVKLKNILVDGNKALLESQECVKAISKENQRLLTALGKIASWDFGYDCDAIVKFAQKELDGVKNE